MAVHVHYNSWYISLSSPAQQQCKKTKFCAFWKTQTVVAKFLYFHMELNVGVTYLA